MTQGAVPAPHANREPIPREALLAVGTVALYLLGALWSRDLSLDGPVLIWFPPAALGIAALYLRPRLLPLLIAADIVSTAVIMGYADEFGAFWAVVNSTVIVGAYGIAGAALRHLRLDPELRSPDHLLRLAAGAMVVGPVLAALAGVAVQAAAGLVEWSDYLRSVGIFLVGDAVAVACLTPAALLLGRAALAGEPPALADGPERSNVLLVLAYLVPAGVALVMMNLGGTPLRFSYLAFLPLVLIALRTGVRGAVLSAALLGAVMTAAAAMQADDAVERSDYQIQLLVLTASATVIGTVVSARRDGAEGRRRLSEIIEATPDLVATLDQHGALQYVNPAGRHLLELSPGAAVGKAFGDLLPDDLARDVLAHALAVAARSGSWSGETRLCRPDGRAVAVSQVVLAHRRQGVLQGFSTVCRDVTERQQLEAQLRHAALYDDATGLPNRTLLLEQLGRMLDEPDRRHPVAALLLDIDDLGAINETYGFDAGTQLVATIAGLLEGSVRAHDVLARYGGAQFVVAMPAIADDYEAILVANRLLASLNEPVVVDGHHLRVTGSVGVALVDSGLPLDAVRAAEIALHRAKEAGGGRFAVYDPLLQQRSQKRLALEADLRDVLSTRSWWLAYQPVVETASGTVRGVEALLRWTHPERGPVTPFDLIRLAERSGIIVPLGLDIFRRACEEAQRWHADGHDLTVSINVSARQLRDPAFVSDVRSILEETGIAPGRVVVELTETVLATREHGEITALNGLRSQGCLVALDDFGTGYSSLSGLRDLPIDVVKLDQSFITELDRSARATALVRAVIELADALELVVVAEGVETDRQLATLRELGCHRYQGYNFCPPVPAPDITALLAEPDTA